MLSTIVIDSDDFEAGVKFWSEALGVKETWRDETYVGFEKVQGLDIVMQKVPEKKTAKSRVHLDFMSEDVEAEVKRLEKLGAKRVAQIETWWWMEDPCGNEFCVLRVSRDDFAAHAKTWKD
jgi:predicted enzyme related to lactoylglutathione lyase